MPGVSPRLLYAAIAVVAVATGGGLWLATRAPSANPRGVPSGVAPSALFAASFSDTQGRTHSLGEFQGRILVVNFWATWCGPCREEMPAFARLHERWKGRGVQFVGLADDDPMKVERFARELAIPYPLWIGGEAARNLSQRLGNRLGVLPHTVILDASGAPLVAKVGPYTEAELEEKIRAISAM